MEKAEVLAEHGADVPEALNVVPEKVDAGGGS